jgi:hypothetical protein
MYKKRIQSDQKGIVRAGAKPSSQKRMRWDYFIAEMLFQVKKPPLFGGDSTYKRNFDKGFNKKTMKERHLRE